MSENEALIHRLFSHLSDQDPKAMEDCYHPDATFKDIAFTLEGRGQIRAMWDMICIKGTPDKPRKSDIEAKVMEASANEDSGRALVIDSYTFGGDGGDDKGRRVVNKIESKFEFRDGLIFRQIDVCDRKEWARKAYGGITGFLLGHLGFVVRLMAMRKLKKAHPHAF